MKTLLRTTLALFLLSLAACGNKGDLVRPAEATPAAPAAAADS
jgi:predicted small lipoprotein YifL